MDVSKKIYLFIYKTRIEDLLSRIREKFPEQIPFHEEEGLVKNRLFYGSRKSTRDGVKYCYTDTRVEDINFLKECRNKQDYSTSCKPNIERVKVKIVVVTINSNVSAEFANQLKQQQLRSLMSQMVSLLTAFQQQSHLQQHSHFQGIDMKMLEVEGDGEAEEIVE